VTAARRRVLRSGSELPEQVAERLAPRSQRADGAGIVDRGFDLAAVADDPGVIQQPRDVRRAEGGDRLDLEVGEGPPEAVSLAQDREPGEARLESLQGEQLEQGAIVA
jgi:hypothetical protein